ncbi:hypothetical protein ACFSTC_31370 [Nonomuraea ferruginea]
MISAVRLARQGRHRAVPRVPHGRRARRRRHGRRRAHRAAGAHPGAQLTAVR